MPAGRRLRPRSRSARTAPSSSASVPRGRAVKRSQCLRLPRRAPGRMSVPTGSPRATSSSTSLRRPRHSTVAAPERPAASAAWSFVCMPPRPNAVPGPPARARISSRERLDDAEQRRRRLACDGRALVEPLHVGAGSRAGRRRRGRRSSPRGCRCRRSGSPRSRPCRSRSRSARRRGRAASSRCVVRSGSARGPGGPGASRAPAPRGARSARSGAGRSRRARSARPKRRPASPGSCARCASSRARGSRTRSRPTRRARRASRRRTARRSGARASRSAGR